MQSVVLYRIICNIMRILLPSLGPDRGGWLVLALCVCCRLCSCQPTSVRPRAQFIMDTYVPLHPDLRVMSDSHFDPEFLSGFRSGRPVLTEVHPFVYSFR